MPKFELHEDPYKPQENDGIYRYDRLPRELKVQIFSLIQMSAVHRNNPARRKAYEDYLERIGAPAKTNVSPAERPLQPYIEKFSARMDVNEFTVKTLCYEYGVFTLPELPFYQNESENYSRVIVAGLPNYDKGPRDFREELKNFLLLDKEMKHDLNAIKLAFDFISEYTPPHQKKIFLPPTIEELNSVFRRHRIGYEFGDNGFTRMDSQFYHEKVVKRALKLFASPGYGNAEKEFLSAYENYQKENYAAALNECNNSLESVLKVICKKQKWNCKQKSARVLIQTAISAGLIPQPWEKHISVLPDFLAAVSKARNQFSAHGKGVEEAASITPHMIAYALHMTAASAIFLVEAEKIIKHPDHSTTQPDTHQTD